MVASLEGCGSNAFRSVWPRAAIAQSRCTVLPESILSASCGIRNSASKKQIFGEDIEDSTRRECGGSFRGPCDIDLIPSDRPRTPERHAADILLLAHVEHPCADRSAGGYAAARLRPRRRPMHQVEVCYMTEMWSDVMSGLVRMAIDIPPPIYSSSVITLRPSGRKPDGACSRPERSPGSGSRPMSPRASAL